MPYIGTDYVAPELRLEFASNKFFRYLLNDLFTIVIIHGYFLKKRYTRFAFVLMVFGLVVLLPIYLYLYFSEIPGISSMVSHLHRIVLNPVIMMLLIPSLFYQESRARTKRIND
jgi:exosortase F-associated protein